MNEGRTRVGLRDAAVVAALCVFVLTTAGAIGMGGRMHAKTQMCAINLKKIGQALPIYCESYDGRLPSPAGDATDGVAGIRTPYEVCRDPDTNAATDNNTWMNLGCLYKSQLITSGRQLYCPANPNGLTEYEAYCTGLDANGNMVVAPWGTLPNWPTKASTWWRVETKRGYAFWPQSKRMLTQADYNVMSARGESPIARYQVGLPATPVQLADLDPVRAFSCDYQAVWVSNAGFVVQVVFGDGHVNMQKVPVDAITGKNWYPYQSSPPAGEPLSKWQEVVPTVRYFYALQP